MEDLHVDISQHGPVTVLTLVGGLTNKHIPALRRAAFQAETQSSGHFVIDMTEVEEIDGYGLSTLVGILSRRAGHHSKVALFGVRPDLRQRFEATFCDTLFPIRPTLAEALIALGEDQPVTASAGDHH